MAYQSINPSNGIPGKSYPFASAQQIESILQDASESYQLARLEPISQRSAYLLRIADLLEKDAETFGRIMTVEMGKPLSAAIAEAKKCAWVCRYYAEQAPAFLAPQSVETDASESFVAYQPLGVVLGIMPWNFPFWQVLRFAAPALMAGNTVVVKHAPNVPECAIALEEVFRNAATGDPVYFNLFTDVQHVPNIIADSRIQGVSLTGSVRAGKSVAAAAAVSLKQSVLELGGSDPFIVLADADIPAAVEAGVQSRFLNNGQSCIAAKRFILEKPVAASFLDQFVSRVENLVVGDPLLESTDIGPMARSDLRDSLHSQVLASQESGANVRTGGAFVDGPGCFYLPTVLTDVAPGQPAFDEELFGPVAACTIVNDAEEAMEQANRTRFGLGATVFTQDSAKADKFADGIQAGNVFINGIVKSDPRLPFGGIKESGWGRELAIQGAHSFVNIKTVWKK